MMCDLCGTAFTEIGNLKRHRLTKHSADVTRTRTCQFCDKTFTRSDALTRHLQNFHKRREKKPVKETLYECLSCDRAYTLRNNLRRHVKKVHGNDALTTCNDVSSRNEQASPIALSNVDVPVTSNDVSNIYDQAVELIASSNVRKQASNFKCVSCAHVSPNYKSFTAHLQDKHDFTVNVERREFQSMPEFKIWQEYMAGKNSECYVNRRGVRSCSGGKMFKLQCHRSGHYIPRGDGLRETRQHIAKINGTCPSRMDVFEKEDGSVQVVWHKEHFGHECNLKFLKLTRAEREDIANKLSQNISFDAILDGFGDSVESSENFKRIHLLGTRDLWNLLRTVEHNVQAHQTDCLSVENIVQSLSKKGSKNPVLFYKPQDQPCLCSYPDCSLDDSDFMIVISTPYQREELAPYTDQKVLIDSTHGTNRHDFQLTVLASVDSAGIGIPVAYCISNRVNEESMCQFFRVLKGNIRKYSPSTKVFMSDMVNEFYNAWTKVMGQSLNVLYCSWHVDRRWRLKVKEKVRGLSKQAEVYRALITLQNILDVEWFEISLAGFRDMLKEDDDTKPFLKSLESYASTKTKWAYCFRAGLGLNCKMSLESMFRKLKHSYIKGKTLRRADECISLLLRSARNLGFERVNSCEGNNSHRHKLILASHKKSLDISDELVLETEGAWEVKSSQPGSDNFYIVENVNNDCFDCELVCNHCSVCIHEFKCECHDYLNRGNMCKHIHAVAQRLTSSDCDDDESRSLGESDSEATLCDKGNDEQCAGKDVMNHDRWGPLAQSIEQLVGALADKSVSEDVIDGGLKYLEVLQKELNRLNAPPPLASLSVPASHHASQFHD